MKRDLYRLFEDKFRGSESLIKGRLNVYLPAIKAIARSKASPHALDLGCGRGEWLELLMENGFHGQGVDLNTIMLESARKRNLNVIEGDAIQSLQAQKDQSLSLVSAFHLIEHISFEQLHILIKQAFRVLEPGGLLILETPNVQNLNVDANTFYLDPTHIRPVPSLLLEFLAETIGFSRYKILYLQESFGTDITLKDVLVGGSPDCALVAQKPGNDELDRLLAPFFAVTYGVNMIELASRYESKQVEKVHLLEKQIRSLEEQVAAITQTTQAKEQQIIDLLQSTSWKITAPLRSITKAVSRLRRHSRHMLKQTLISIIEVARRSLTKHPIVRSRILRLLGRTPWLLDLGRRLTNSAGEHEIQPKTFDELRVVKLLSAVQLRQAKGNLVFLTTSEEQKNV